MVEGAYDAVVVGAGAGGGAVAWRMTQRGWRVLLIDAGPAFDPDRDYGLDRPDWKKSAFGTSLAARAKPASRRCSLSTPRSPTCARGAWPRV